MNMKLKQTRYGAKSYLKFGVQIMDKNGRWWMKILILWKWMKFIHENCNNGNNVFDSMLVKMLVMMLGMSFMTTICIEQQH
jgi:hypothetical protein